jgi:type II secretory pathway component PulJ
MSSPISRCTTQDTHHSSTFKNTSPLIPSKASPTKANQASSRVFELREKEPPSALDKWIDEKLSDWEAGKQERDNRLIKVAETSQIGARERNKVLEEEIQKLRDEFDKSVAESKKGSSKTLDVNAEP